MAEITDADRAKARAMLKRYGLPQVEPYMEDEIARAIAEAREEGRAEILSRPANLTLVARAMEQHGIVDCTGPTPVVRRVLGTLPITADGCVVGNGHPPLWWRTAAGRLESSVETYIIEICCGGIKYAYSTAEAAESAKGTP